MKAFRVLLISGYHLPSHHKKAEIIANESDFELVQILQPGSGRNSGIYPSANGQRSYRIFELPILHLGAKGDPHRTIHWPPQFRIQSFRPDLIVCEHEQESLMAAEVAQARSFIAKSTPLVLYSWQNILRRRSWLTKLVCNYTLHSAQHIVCANQEATKVLRTQDFAGGTTVIPLFGVDTEEFYPTSGSAYFPELQGAELVVGYVGRLVKEKGIDLLLRAFARLNRKAKLLIVGDGEEKQNLMQLARDAGIAEQVIIKPSVPFAHMPQVMNSLDILVLPSRTTAQWKEQFGRVLVEAMACKVAVIGSTSGAIPEVIGDAGSTFPEEDTDALAEILNELATHESLRHAHAQRGYERVLSRYTIECVAQQNINLWRDIL